MSTNLRSQTCPAFLLLVAACLTSLLLANTASAKIDVKGKVVLANVGKYPVHFRVGKTWDSDPVLRALTRFIAKEVADGFAPTW